MSYFVGIDLKNNKAQLDDVELNTDLTKVLTHHITVFYLGSFDDDQKLSKIKGRLETFDYKRFSLTADSLYEFSDVDRDQFLALGFKDRKPLFNLLFSLIEHLDEMPKGGSGFQHVTLYRTEDNLNPEELKRKIVKELKEPIDIEVKDLLLYKTNYHNSKILNDHVEIVRVPLI